MKLNQIQDAFGGHLRGLRQLAGVNSLQVSLKDREI